MKQLIALPDRLLKDQTSLGLLALRIAIGVVFIAHGGQKLFVYTIPGVAGAFEGMDIPFPVVSAWLATLAEFLGGIMILLGLLTRWSAIPLAATMVVAFTVHAADGFFVPDGFEYVFTLFLGIAALFFAGPGRYSLDYLLAGWLNTPHASFAAEEQLAASRFTV